MRIDLPDDDAIARDRNGAPIDPWIRGILSNRVCVAGGESKHLAIDRRATKWRYTSADFHLLGFRSISIYTRI